MLSYVMICNAGFGVEGSAEDVTSEHMRNRLDPYRNARGLVRLNAIAPAFCDRFVKKFGRQRTDT